MSHPDKFHHQVEFVVSVKFFDKRDDIDVLHAPQNRNLILNHLFFASAFWLADNLQCKFPFLCSKAISKLYQHNRWCCVVQTIWKVTKRKLSTKITDRGRADQTIRTSDFLEMHHFCQFNFIKRRDTNIVTIDLKYWLQLPVCTFFDHSEIPFSYNLSNFVSCC